MMEKKAMFCKEQKAEQRLTEEILRLPLCHTLEAEAFGAGIKPDRCGAMVREPACSHAGEIPLEMNLNTTRIQIWEQVIKEFSGNFPEILLVYDLEGPLSVLCMLLPLEEAYGLLADDGENCLRVTAEQLAQYAGRLYKCGVRLFSVADPSANPEITGPRMFVSYQKVFLHYLNVLRKHCPDAVFHLCGALSLGMAECGLCTVEDVEAGQKSYIASLEQYRKQYGGACFGLTCINNKEFSGSMKKLVFQKSI